MSFSEPEKELLLSASLDGALSPDEQAMLDQWFQEDPSALRQREELAEVRDQLRAALSPLRQAKLDQQFAQRVVEAAIQQAQRESLGADHPLVRLAAQPAAADRPSATAAWRWAAAVVALAASLLLAVYLGQSQNDAPVDRLQELAQVDAAASPSADPAVDRLAAGGSAADGRAASADDPADPATTDVQDRSAEPIAALPSSLAAEPQNQLIPQNPSPPALGGERLRFRTICRCAADDAGGINARCDGTAGGRWR